MDELVLTPEQKLKCDKDFAAMNARFDIAEAELANSGLDLIDFPLEHTFTKGLYSRKIFMPAGSLLTSKIHMTEHQFAILQGEATIWNPYDGTQLLKAPHTGVTRPGTRRMLFIHSDMIFVTYHPTDKNTPTEVEDDILWHRVNPLITKEHNELVTA